MSTAATPDTVRKDQQGTVFRATIKDDADDSVVDVSGATTLEIKAKKPDGTILTKTATTTTDGTDGDIEFSDDSGELVDTVGDWTYWGRVVFSDGSSFPSTALHYSVEAEGSL